jgi:RNA polymerase sigma-70 factor (ECF subfamily)
MARDFAPFVRPALVNGTAGVIAFDGDTPFAILAFVIVNERVHSIDVFNDSELVPRLLRPVGAGGD